MTSRTQCARILRVLERSGKTGTTQLDWLSPTIDGGPPILRLPARVSDLRARGHAIVSTIEPIGRAHLARYRLRPVVAASAAAAADVEQAVEQASLDLDDPGRRPRSPLDPEVA